MTDAGVPTDSEDPVTQVAPADPAQRWAAFAPQPPRPPGRLRRIGAAIGRFFGHEWTLATLASVALAVVMTWPALRYPRYTLPQDLGDPTLVSWMLSWPGHILLSDPMSLWHGNAFFPERWSYAFTDSLLGYAPAGIIGSGVSDALLRYNLLFVAVHALAFLGAYALVRQLGAGRIGAIVAGLAFAYAPWRLAQAGHLHVLSTGAIALALAMLARGHGWSLRYGYRPDRVRPGWIVAGWLVAAWQISLGFGIGLAFGYVVTIGVVLVAGAWVVRRIARRPRHRIGAVWGTNLAGGTVFAAVTLLMALPYLVVADQHPQAQRSLTEVGYFSPPVSGFFTAPQESWLWGERHEGLRAVLGVPTEMAILPGFALIALAVAGLVFSIWSWRARLALAGGVVLTATIAMGTALFDGALYQPLYYTLPGWDALRTPGRLVIWITLLLAVLAAGTLTALAIRARELAVAARGTAWPGPWLRTLTLVPVVLVLLEGFGNTPHPVAPAAPRALTEVAAPILVLPSSEETDRHVMLWSTEGFPPVVNGASGFLPERLAEVREVTASFPDAQSVSYLRSLGVETVVVLTDRAVDTDWEQAITASGHGLGITREEVDHTVVFHLNPSTG